MGSSAAGGASGSWSGGWLLTCSDMRKTVTTSTRCHRRYHLKTDVSRRSEWVGNPPTILGGLPLGLMALSISLFSAALDFTLAAALPLVTFRCAFVPVEQTERFGDLSVSQTLRSGRSTAKA